MKALFFIILSNFSFSNAEVVNFNDHLNSCKNRLSNTSSLRYRVGTDGFTVYNLHKGPHRPEFIDPDKFFNSSLSIDAQLFIYREEHGPFFGIKGPEKWRALESTSLDFAKGFEVMVREPDSEGLLRLTRYSRFKLSKATLVFSEIFNFFKTTTGTMASDTGNETIGVLRADTPKDRMVAMIESWGISSHFMNTHQFKERVIKVINNPQLDLSDPRSVRFYYSEIIRLFREHFTSARGHEQKYQKMLDRLEQKGLLQYLVLYSLD